MEDVREALAEPHGNVQREEEVQPTLRAARHATDVSFPRETAGKGVLEWQGARGRAADHDAVQTRDGGGDAQRVKKPDEVPRD